MATVFDSVDICGLRRTHFRQLLSYAESAEDQGWYYGNKKQFNQRHSDLIEWIVAIVDYASNDGIIIPKNKGD